MYVNVCVCLSVLGVCVCVGGGGHGDLGGLVVMLSSAKNYSRRKDLYQIFSCAWLFMLTH